MTKKELEFEPIIWE